MDKERNFYVYCLFRPWNLEPCYIGKGKGGRVQSHYRNGVNHPNRHLANIFSKSKNNEIPFVVLHDNLDESTAFIYERAFIAAIGRSDLKKGPLCNLTDGGEGASGFSDAVLEKIRDFAKKRKLSDSSKTKVSLANKGKIVSEETRKKISASHKARLDLGCSPNSTGNRHSEETKILIGAAHKGKLVSQETRKRQSLARRGVQMSEMTKSRMSSSKKGRTYSNEQRSAISAGLKLYHARRRAELEVGAQ